MIEKKHFLRMGTYVFLVTFLLLVFAVRFILGNPLETQNYIAFLILSGMAGIITSVLIYSQARIAAGFFIFGLGLGFFEMYRVFSRDMAGWGDLIGLISLFMWAVIGLGAGLLIQIGLKIFQRRRVE